MAVHPCLGWIFALAAMLLGACGSSDATSCACSAAEYCCLGTCQPLGSVCGAGDAGGEGDGRVPSGDGGGVADAALDGGGPVCASPCNEGYECVAWTDPADGSSHNNCLTTGSVPCDPAVNTSRCDGTTRILCIAFSGYPRMGPPGTEVASDCTSHHGPGATCVTEAGGTARCMGTPCDPATFMPRCDSASDDVMLSCDPTERFVRHDTCRPEWRCLVNEHTLADGGGAACIPRIAVMSAMATAARTPLSCDGEAIHVQQYGYEWSETCFMMERCFSFPASVGGDPARCLSRSTRTCDPATFVPVCDAARTSEETCELGVVRASYCGIGLASGSVPSACDEVTGECAPTTFCPPTGTRPRCSADGRFRITCNMEWAREIAERCACKSDAGGGATCGA